MTAHLLCFFFKTVFPHQEFLRKEESSSHTALSFNIIFKDCPYAPLQPRTENSKNGVLLSLCTACSLVSAMPMLHKKQGEGVITKPKSSRTTLVCVLTGSSCEGSCGYCYVNRSLYKSIILGESLCDVGELG